jgi:hypothetical protein
MLRIVSAAVAATLFGFTGLASAQTGNYPYATDRSTNAPAYRGYEQNTRGYDQNTRGYDQNGTQQNARWGTTPMTGSAAPNTTRYREYGATRSNNHFASEGEARSGCRGDTVVWVNIKSGVYHFTGSHSYGNTKHGAFMCRADADRSGSYRAAKHELPMQQNPGRTLAPQSGSSMYR